MIRLDQQSYSDMLDVPPEFGVSKLPSVFLFGIILFYWIYFMNKTWVQPTELQ